MLKTIVTGHAFRYSGRGPSRSSVGWDLLGSGEFDAEEPPRCSGWIGIPLAHIAVGAGRGQDVQDPHGAAGPVQTEAAGACAVVASGGAGQPGEEVQGHLLVVAVSLGVDGSGVVAGQKIVELTHELRDVAACLFGAGHDGRLMPRWRTGRGARQPQCARAYPRA